VLGVRELRKLLQGVGRSEFARHRFSVYLLYSYKSTTFLASLAPHTYFTGTNVLILTQASSRDIELETFLASLAPHTRVRDDGANSLALAALEAHVAVVKGGGSELSRTERPLEFAPTAAASSRDLDTERMEAVASVMGETQTRLQQRMHARSTLSHQIGQHSKHTRMSSMGAKQPVLKLILDDNQLRSLPEVHRGQYTVKVSASGAQSGGGRQSKIQVGSAGFELRLLHAGLACMHTLTSLSIRGNLLTHLPVSLLALTRLLTLHADNNLISYWEEPPAGTGVSGGGGGTLVTLTLSENRLKELPAPVKTLTNLTHLEINDNPKLYTSLRPYTPHAS
jgi:hypothetical protein